MSHKIKTLSLYGREDVFDQMINIEPNYDNERQFISKKMKRFFILIQMVLCLDFGFIEYNSKQIKIWVKLWVVVWGLFQGAIMVIILLALDSSDHLIWGVKFIIEYYFYIMIVLLTPENISFCSYQMKLQHFDRNIHIESSSYKINRKLLIYWSLAAFYDLLSIFLYYYFCDDYVTLVLLMIMYYIPLRALSFPLIVLFFVFYSAYRRLENLKIYIKKRKSSVQRAQLLYRYLLDSLENVLRTMKYILIVHMIFNIPTVIASIYIVLKALRDNDEINFETIAPYIDLLPIITLEVVPTIASSWLSQEAMDIKIMLHNQVLEESDENQTRAMEKFIRYTEARPFKFYMLAVIPMDATLPFILLNLCVTYLIVCLQLTHIY